LFVFLKKITQNIFHKILEQPPFCHMAIIHYKNSRTTIIFCGSAKITKNRMKMAFGGVKLTLYVNKPDKKFYGLR